MLPNLAARLFTLTGDLVCVTAPDGYFLLLNPAFECVQPGRVLGANHDLIARAIAALLEPALIGGL